MSAVIEPRSGDAVLAQLEAMRAGDTDWRAGRVFYAAVVDDYLADLATVVTEVGRDPSLARSGTAPMYGMAAKLPVRGLVASRVRKVIAELYSHRRGDT